MSDTLVKAIGKGVRVYAAVTTEAVNEAAKRHDCYPVAAAALGRTMTGALLMAANLKNKEAITVNFRGDGPLKNITADACPEGFVRGYVADPHVELPLNDKGKLDVGRAVGNGMVNVTRFTGLSKPMHSSCEIVTGEIAEDLTNYLYTSEQTPSSIGLGVLVNRDYTVKAAGGFMIQPMPDADEAVIAKLEDNLKKIRSVSAMIDEGLTPEEIIKEIMPGLDMKILSTTDLRFKCQCSKNRLEDVLLNLNRNDMLSLIEDGEAEVCCQFCNTKYHFSKEELQQILKLADAVK